MASPYRLVPGNTTEGGRVISYHGSAGARPALTGLFEEAAMRYGVTLPSGGVCGDAHILAELGCLAEEAGWDGVFVEDYIVHQSDGAVPTCDPWIALAA